MDDPEGAPGPSSSAGPHLGRRRLEALLGVPFTEGNRLDVLRNGDEVFPALLQAVAASTRSIDLLWFLWGRGPVTDALTAALADRARAGVRVRVLLDGFGAHGTPPGQVQQLRSAGCEVLFYRPLRGTRITTLNKRTHRRVLVCDETTAFTGGTGLDQSWTGSAQSPAHWRDTAYRLRGPAVDGVRSAFAQDWLQAPLPLVTSHDRFPGHAPSGTTPVQVVPATSQPGLNTSGLAVLSLLDVAQHQVRITTPYARLPERFHEALAAAVRRGVRVQLLTCGRHVERQFVAAQSRHEYARLLAAGVELWRYEPTLLHHKCITVDGQLAMVGTTNLDVRSVTLNEQVNLLVDDARVAAVLDAHLEEDLRSSHRLQPERWGARGVRRRAVDAAASLLGLPLQGLGTRGQAGRRP